jgi:hypothetical protein
VTALEAGLGEQGLVGFNLQRPGEAADPGFHVAPKCAGSAMTLLVAGVGTNVSTLGPVARAMGRRSARHRLDGHGVPDHGGGLGRMD